MFPSDELVVVIQDQEVRVSYPNAGAWINIEKARIVLSEGMYAELMQSRLKSALRSLDSIDTIAFFEHSSPELRKRFNVKTLSELKQSDMILLIALYQEKIAPWLNEWEEALYPEAAKVAGA